MAFRNPLQGSATVSVAGGAVAVSSAVALIQENTEAVSEGATYQLPDVTGDTVHLITLTGNATLEFPAAAAGKSFLLGLLQDATGSRTVTWPGAVKWASGTAPTLTTTAAKLDLFSFICLDGTNWIGVVAGENF